MPCLPTLVFMTSITGLGLTPCHGPRLKEVVIVLIEGIIAFPTLTKCIHGLGLKGLGSTVGN
jgi:hypothetical protein